jgi:hypothetical protein
VNGVHRATPLWLGLAAASCVFGPTLAKFEPAHVPTGLAVRLVTNAGTVVVGELLEVREDALLVDAAGVITLVPYDAIKSANTSTPARVRFGGGRAPDTSTRNRLRLLSRFPQGLSPALLQRLLENRRQGEPKRVG